METPFVASKKKIAQRFTFFLNVLFVILGITFILIAYFVKPGSLGIRVVLFGVGGAFFGSSLSEVIQIAVNWLIYDKSIYAKYVSVETNGIPRKWYIYHESWCEDKKHWRFLEFNFKINPEDGLAHDFVTYSHPKLKNVLVKYKADFQFFTNQVICQMASSENNEMSFCLFPYDGSVWLKGLRAGVWSHQDFDNRPRVDRAIFTYEAIEDIKIEDGYGLIVDTDSIDRLRQLWQNQYPSAGLLN